jgi:hypothetical protein
VFLRNILSAIFRAEEYAKHATSKTLKMKAAYSCKTLVNSYYTSQHPRRQYFVKSFNLGSYLKATFSRPFFENIALSLITIFVCDIRSDI